MREIFVSIDVEADGPIPGRNSMLSFGAFAFNPHAYSPYSDSQVFSANLEVLPEAKPSPDTMAWWADKPEAWAAHRQNLQKPSDAMASFVQWVRRLPGKPVIVGYPVTFDFMYLYWYTMAFGGLQDGEPCPFGIEGLDITTLAWAKMGCHFHDTSNRMRADWFKGCPPHNHQALSDATRQGVLLFNMLNNQPPTFRTEF